MKYLLLMMIAVCCISSKKIEYFKINKSKDVDIMYEITARTSDKNAELIYYIKNKTGSTFIIDPFGFWGSTSVYDNNNLIDPYKLGLKGYYERFNDKWCERDLLILKPYELIKLDVFNTNYKNTGLYHFDPSKNYYQIIRSVHNKQTILYLGCEKYIQDLQSKGYKVLEDSINAKIPLYPNY